MKLRCSECQKKVTYNTPSGFSRAFNNPTRKCRPCLKKVWARTHVESVKASKAAWNKNNPLYQNRYYKKHKRQLLNSRRVWRKENWDQVSASVRHTSHKRRAVIKTGSATREDIKKLLAEVGDCPLCGVRMNSIKQHKRSKTIDHVVPLCVGGKHEFSNLRVICRKCNISRPRSLYEKIDND